MGNNGPSWGRRHVIQKRAFDYWRAKQREADAAALALWNIQIESGGAHRPSPTLGAALNGGYNFLRVRCTACRQYGFIPIAQIRRPQDTPLWKLEDSLVCRHCRGSRHFAPRARIERVTRSDQEYGWANP